MQEIKELFESQQANQFNVGLTTAKERLTKLKKLLKAIEDNEQQIQEAIHQDLRRHPTETLVIEVYPLIKEIKHIISHLEKWMQPKKVKTPTTLTGTSSYIRYEPKGVVLIISPWNFPILLTLAPLAAAIAAGNCVILKPSEYTNASSRFMKMLIGELFEQHEVALCQGGVQLAEELLQKPFNHIFFTGSPQVGKLVMKAAAEHLASVTLELGGKSPVIIDDSANLDDAAKKIVWGKFANAGQTCIAPDYVLVEANKKEELIERLVHSVKTFYGESSQERIQNMDFARIVNDKHFQRSRSLIRDAKDRGAVVEVGGTVAAEELYIAPTILSDIDLDSKIMQEEIFAPILPVISYHALSEAIHFVRQKPKPLALYMFSKNKHNIEKVTQYTSSGGMCVNQVLVHYFQSYLPFGGINNSGIGKAHGFWSFEAFSNAKSILEQNLPLSASTLMYPPYGKEIKNLMDFTIKWL